MDLIKGYASDSDTEHKTTDHISSTPNLPKINLAPDVDITQLVEDNQNKKEQRLNKLKPIEESKNILNGTIETWNMHSFNFDEQHYNFIKYGFAQDPNVDSRKIVISERDNNDTSKINIKFADTNSTEFITKSVFGPTSTDEKKLKQDLAKKRKKFGDAATGEFLGPWASYEGAEEKVIKESEELIEERKQILTSIEEKRKKRLEDLKAAEALEIKSVFHGDQMFDYKGRSYILPPTDLKPHSHVCYIPKRCIHTFSGHTKEVQVIKFFPKYGHYLLSASFDAKVKLWDVLGSKKCVRTYMGHREAVRDITFTNDGLHFLSASYDRTIHYWDTETGKVIKTFNVKKFPYCVRFNPDEDKQHSFLCASQNKKIAQFDIRTGNRSQQYDEHLGAVNTVTFVDGGRKFVSTSDDKKIFLWEFGIPVVIKHISEPEMHSITATTMHPSGKYFAGQSADNKIVIYDTKQGNFRLNRKKKYTGHVTAGYSIGLSFSADGQFIASGDQEGKVWFWDWKTTKNLRSFAAHEKVCASVDWHPIEPSRFATCGWDGTIKLWD